MKIKLLNNTILWARRLALYSSLGVLVILISHLVFSYFSLLHTDVDSGRYMLSALIQGEFAVVALVVTLSIVAVQLAAQSYSARVIEVFRKTPDLWILMGIYGIAIFYGLSVLKLIERVNPLVNSLSNLEAHISFSYYLGVFAFVTLWPYIWGTLNLLKPSTVVNLLAERITKANILSAMEEIQDKKISESDPIQPIVDIVRGALMRYDYETVRVGLRVIENRTNHILKKETFKEAEEEKISKHIFAHLTRVGKLAVSRKDEESTLEVMIDIQRSGEAAAEQNLDDATQKAVLSLRDVGMFAAKQKLEDIAWWAAHFLETIGMIAAKQKLENAAKQAVKSIGIIGKMAAAQQFEDATLWAAFYCEAVGIASAEQNLDDATKQAAEALVEIGKESANQKFEKATKQVVLSLGLIGEASVEQKLTAAKQVAEFLEEVGKAATVYKLEGATKQVEESHRKINEALIKSQQNNVLPPTRNT